MDEEMNVIWLAGLLEGEGYFGTVRERSTGKDKALLEVQMTDLDIIERVQILFTTKINVRPPVGRGRQTTYRIRAKGNRAEAIMFAILPYMGKRRTQRITSILTKGSPIENFIPKDTETIREEKRNSTAMKNNRVCDICGMIANIGNLGRHQNANGHKGWQFLEEEKKDPSFTAAR